jgi:hypothetical protein
MVDTEQHGVREPQIVEGSQLAPGGVPSRIRILDDAVLPTSDHNTDGHVLRPKGVVEMVTVYGA